MSWLDLRSGRSDREAEQSTAQREQPFGFAQRIALFDRSTHHKEDPKGDQHGENPHEKFLLQRLKLVVHHVRGLGLREVEIQQPILEDLRRETVFIQHQRASFDLLPYNQADNPSKNLLVEVSRLVRVLGTAAL